MLLPTPLAQDQALRALAEVRAAVDRSTRYSTFSALSGFLAAAAALIGSGGCGLFPQFVGAQPQRGWGFVGVWGVILIVAATSHIGLTALKGWRRGEAVWTPIARTALLALLGPGLAALAASAVLAMTEQWRMLPGLWLTMYGCGLWGVSFFAPLFLRWLGVVSIALGLLAWGYPQQAALWMGLGFGGLHLVFSVIVLARYRR